MNDQARFESLEIKLMHLEDALAGLSDANARAQRELTELRERLRISASGWPATRTRRAPALPRMSRRPTTERLPAA